jgi:hypothetical protein
LNICPHNLLQLLVFFVSIPQRVERIKPAGELVEAAAEAEQVGCMAGLGLIVASCKSQT